MRWNCRQRHTSSTKSKMRIEIKVLNNKILVREPHAKSSQLPTRSVKSQWVSKVLLVVCKMQLIKRRRSKIVVSRQMTMHQIRAVPWRAWSTLQTQAHTRSSQANLTKALSKIKMHNHPWRINLQKSQVWLKTRQVVQVVSNSKKKY